MGSLIRSGIWVIVVGALAASVVGLLWCCLRCGREEPVEMEKQEPKPRRFAHEPMDLRLPDRDKEGL